jgi:hypothetical protein
MRGASQDGMHRQCPVYVAALADSSASVKTTRASLSSTRRKGIEGAHLEKRSLENDMQHL